MLGNDVRTNPNMLAGMMFIPFCPVAATAMMPDAENESSTRKTVGYSVGAADAVIVLKLLQRLVKLDYRLRGGKIRDICENLLTMLCRRGLEGLQ